MASPSGRSVGPRRTSVEGEGAKGEGEEALTQWDLVSEYSHSNLDTEMRAERWGGGSDGTGKAAPSQGALRALTV